MADDDIPEEDAEAYSAIVTLWEAGRSLGGFAARIHELVEVYGQDRESMRLLRTLKRAADHEDELESKMATFASEADRSEAERFADPARAVGEHLARESERSHLPVDEVTATFLLLDPGPQPRAKIARHLAERIHDTFSESLKRSVGSAVGQGDTWQEVLGAYEKQRSAMAGLLPEDVDPSVDVLLDSQRRWLSTLAEAEAALSSKVSNALLAEGDERYSRFAAVLGLLRRAVFEDDSAGLEPMLANGMARVIERADLALETDHAARRAKKLAGDLGHHPARSNRDTWESMLMKEHAELSASLEGVTGLVRELAALRASVTTSVGAARPMAKLRHEVAFADVGYEAVQSAWQRLAGISGGADRLGRLSKDAEQARDSISGRLGSLPPLPPQTDDAAQDWQQWVGAARTALGEHFEAAVLSRARDEASQVFEATERELSRWRLSRELRGPILKAIAAGSSWRDVADIARQNNKGALASALEHVFPAAERAADWSELESVCDSVGSEVRSVMFAISSVPELVDRLGSLLLAASSAPPGASGWQPWTDAFGDRAASWSALLRYVARADELVRAPAGPVAGLLEVRPGVRLAGLADAHRVLRSIGEPPVRPETFGAHAPAVAAVLERIRGDIERTQVLLESRIALWTSLEPVPLERPNPKLRPLWELHSEMERAAYLSPTWQATVAAAGEMYWRTRALAPITRRVSRKREYALVGLVSTVHLSPTYLRQEADASDDVPTAEELLQIAMNLNNAVAALSSDPQVAAAVLTKTEGQLRTVGLGLLLLDFPEPGAAAVQQAQWIDSKIRGGFGFPSGSRGEVARLLSLLGDADWILQRCHRLAELAPGPARALQAALASRRADSVSAIPVQSLVEAWVALHDEGEGDEPLPERAATLTLATLQTAGAAAQPAGEQVLWEFVLGSLRQHIRRVKQGLGPQERSSYLTSIRKRVLQSQSAEVLRTRLIHLQFVEPEDDGAKALYAHAQLIR